MSRRVLQVCTLVGVLVAAMPSAAMAQNESRFEVSGSFSYTFADVSGSPITDAGGLGYGGFGFFVNDWLALGAEVGRTDTVGRLDVDVIEFFYRPKVRFPQWTVLFGPRFRIIEHDRIRFGAQVMAGIAHSNAKYDLPDNATVIDGVLKYELPGVFQQQIALDAFEFDFGTVFAATLGVHLDLRLSDRVVWRVFQPDVLITTYRDDVQRSLRIASGIAVEF